MIGLSGQASERNLVSAVNKHQPLIVNIGGQRLKIVGARQLGGGNPEPKADIALITKEGKEIGVSMKKPNFGFFEAWMDEQKLDSLLESVNIESRQRNVIIKALKDEAEKITNSKDFKKEVLSEYNAMVEIMGSDHPINKMAKIAGNRKFKIKEFSTTQKLTTEVKEKLLKDKQKRFGSGGQPSSSFKVTNVYAPLSKLLGTSYENFLRIVIGGSDSNPFKADYVIVETVSPNISEQKLVQILESAKTVNEVIKEYAEDENVDLQFRLRPVTITRAAYSTTNAGKFRKGASFYSDDDVGVSWTVHITKG